MLQNIAKEIPQHSGVKLILLLHERMRLPLFNYYCIYSHSFEIATCDFKNLIANGLDVFRGMEIFNIASLFNEVVLQTNEFAVVAKRTLPCHACQSEMRCAAWREIKIASLKEAGGQGHGRNRTQLNLGRNLTELPSKCDERLLTLGLHLLHQINKTLEVMLGVVRPGRSFGVILD